jgi:HemY protein
VNARLLWLLALLALGGLVGLLVSRDPGYVLIAYDRMAMETSLWFALVLLVAAYVMARVGLYLAFRLLRSRGAFARWNATRRAGAADRRTAHGQLLLAAGHWAEAQKHLTRAASAARAPAVNLLGAACAAQHAGDRTSRDALLMEARAVADDQTAVDFTQATLEHAAGQWTEARATLERLRVRQPAHVDAAWLLADCLRQLGDWQALADLLPQLKNDRGHSAAQRAELERSALLGRMAMGVEAAQRTWATLSKQQRRDVALVAAYARAMAVERPDEAERALHEALQSGWDSGLVDLYGRVATTEPARQLATAEGWLKAHPGDAALFLALGRLALRERRWPQAREYLEMSARLGPSAESQAELGRLYAALGEPRALDVLLEALPGLPDVPLPAGTSVQRS